MQVGPWRPITSLFMYLFIEWDWFKYEISGLFKLTRLKRNKVVTGTQNGSHLFLCPRELLPWTVGLVDILCAGIWLEFSFPFALFRDSVICTRRCSFIDDDDDNDSGGMGGEDGTEGLLRHAFWENRFNVPEISAAVTYCWWMKKYFVVRIPSLV